MKRLKLFSLCALLLLLLLLTACGQRPVAPEPTAEARLAFDETHPDCISAWYGEQPYGYPWRYDGIPAVPAVYSAYYAHMRQLFLYGEGYCWNVKNSPYGPGYLALRE